MGDRNKEVSQRVQSGTSHMRNEFTVKSFFQSCKALEFGPKRFSLRRQCSFWKCSMWPGGRGHRDWLVFSGSEWTRPRRESRCPSESPEGLWVRQTPCSWDGDAAFPFRPNHCVLHWCLSCSVLGKKGCDMIGSALLKDNKTFERRKEADWPVWLLTWPPYPC